jgi:hypothetical protein
MDILDTCETPNCTGKAEHLTSTESKLIQVCRDCYNKKYKK